MKAEELRIGSLVYDTKGEVNTVCVETFVKFNPQIKPIPLTEEWLLKFGFDGNFISPNLKRYSIKGFAINTYSDKSDGEYFWLGYCTNSKNSHIKYVHQLQNLYFALTGEELISTQS